ncbi:AcrR family transcriptional regulator [Spinactinospora alkalitolerans]|uniref:AcrR family transcriptional regulator n=1 Tax=Spinactinospora alkalitolerans TaxID=687207 RepID=A0A852U9U2_9ACTN|nr:TetR/AcrR family transcriptional regulator [Spinactinospora alkalitolerans]NYE50730.1 AcrR family transcriptional regulator [Spinactinospora alkalitolerans]
MNAREPRRRRPQGRQELFQKAAELFATNGYHGTAMSDLEHATGLGRGSIYHYVTSKDDLLYEITTQYLVRLITAGEDLLAQELPVEERLRRFSRKVVRVIVNHQPEMTVCFRDMHEVPEPMRAEVLSLHQRYEHIWAQILKRGQDAGLFRTADTVTVKAVLGLHHYAYLWIQSDGRLSPEEIADVFVDFTLSGITRTDRR